MKKLRNFRISLNKDTTEIAKDLGISKSLYEKIEYGYRKPSRKFIEKFKNKFPKFDINIFFE